MITDDQLNALCESNYPPLAVVREVVEELRRARRQLTNIEAALHPAIDNVGDDVCWMTVRDCLNGIARQFGKSFDWRVGDKDAMLKNCERFVTEACIAGGPWETYAEVMADRDKQKRIADSFRYIIACIDPASELPDASAPDMQINAWLDMKARAEEAECERDRLRAENAELKRLAEAKGPIE